MVGSWNTNTSFLFGWLFREGICQVWHEFSTSWVLQLQAKIRRMCRYAVSWCLSITFILIIYFWTWLAIKWFLGIVYRSLIFAHPSRKALLKRKTQQSANQIPSVTVLSTWNVRSQKGKDESSNHHGSRVLTQEVEPTIKKKNPLELLILSPYETEPSLKLTAKAPENKPSQKESHLPTIHFQG